MSKRPKEVLEEPKKGISVAGEYEVMMEGRQGQGQQEEKQRGQKEEEVVIKDEADTAEGTAVEETEEYITDQDLSSQTYSQKRLYLHMTRDQLVSEINRRKECVANKTLLAQNFKKQRLIKKLCCVKNPVLLKGKPKEFEPEYIIMGSPTSLSHDKLCKRLVSHDLFAQWYNEVVVSEQEQFLLWGNTIPDKLHPVRKRSRKTIDIPITEGINRGLGNGEGDSSTSYLNNSLTPLTPTSKDATILSSLTGTPAISKPTPCNTNNSSPPGGHYSQAMIYNGIAYISGILPITVQGETLSNAPFEEQVAAVLSNLAEILKASKSTPERLLQVRVYVVDLKRWEDFNRLYKEWIGDHKPARCVVPVTALHFSCQIELEAVAACM